MFVDHGVVCRDLCGSDQDIETDHSHTSERVMARALYGIEQELAKGRISLSQLAMCVAKTISHSFTQITFVVGVGGFKFAFTEE